MSHQAFLFPSHLGYFYYLFDFHHHDSVASHISITSLLLFQQSMDSNSRYQLQQQHQPNSGLLRFRSAPTQVLANFKQAEASINSNPWEGSEPLLRFFNSGDTLDTTSPTLREFVDNKVSNDNKQPQESTISSSSSSLSPLSRMNSQQGYSTSVLPSGYPRHDSTVTVTSSMMMGSMGMDQSGKSFNPNLLRQSSFPSGNFSNNISFHNGTVLVLYSVFLYYFLWH